MTRKEKLEALGFTVEDVPDTKQLRVSCDSCQALVINGVATHEHGCYNEKFEVECFECGFEFFSSHYNRFGRQICDDCLGEN
jgi:hypothetical protein